ncbi:glycosyltransferase family 61 protein [Niabella sp. CJ426]|uniref:glycosyltransferase family 61 protein n=1 Tax=Niabella sp. CJ426 TaxID=3393740 RepID=UPI003D038568
MSTVGSILYKIWGKVSNVCLAFRGLSLLSKEETTLALKPFLIHTVPASSLNLPEVFDEKDPNKKIYEAYTFPSEEIYVWKCGFKKGFISKHGSVVIDSKVFCTDWDHRGIKHRFWEKDTRPAKSVPTVIPLLSHHQNHQSAIALTGYYDFVLLLAAKLSRIKDALGEEDVAKCFITYHSFGGAYEREYLELLGFNPDHYIDSRTYKLSGEQVIFGNLGTWKPNVNEILSLKRNIENRLNISNQTPYSGNRVYISRKGRRVIENEAELIELLKEFDFTIIEDKGRSVREQIEIYRNASFIIGPHGASFANVIWCRPGTQLYELFSTSWAPDYFLYMAQINNMKYAAYRDDSHEEIKNDLFKSLCQDIYVSIPHLRASLAAILTGGRPE